jgi:hypothetical protein
MADRHPDFGSFIKQGDERLQMLARPEGLPDLARDATQSQHQVVIQRMQQQLRSGQLQGLSWEQIERLLSELAQSRPQGGGSDLADQLREEMQQQAGSGDQNPMLSALSRALDRLRERGGSARDQGKPLREAPGQSRADGTGGERGTESDDGTPGGSQAGTEPSRQTTGEATARIPGDKQDAGLPGEAREGQPESFDTNLSGPGVQNSSRLQYLDVLSRYRKTMEEALAKEPIPLDYREQVKEYFRSLEVP